MTRMNNLTKLLCALLVLCGLLCCAGAAGAEVVASGDCSAEGSSVQWALDDAGTFTVSGTGAMADYTSSTRPWVDYYDSVTNLVIEDGVTAIGNSSFYGCSNLTSVEMPDSVTSIGKSAFSKCAGLTSLDLPDNVTVIGREAFYACTGLTSLTIPASVTEMDNAFYSCSGLTDITISDGVTSIYGAFYRCTGLTSITIPDSVTSISYAFYGCTGLESIVVPDSVTEMEYAFDGCTGLRSANIPSSATSIRGAFSRCISLTSIEIPDSVTTIGNFAFRGCTGLTSIAIPDSVTTIGSSAFDGCTGLTSIEIPDSVTTIIDQAFYRCTGLKSVAIPNSVTEISFNAFDGCTQVSTVIISCTPNGAVYDCIYQNFRRVEQIYVHAYENGACTDCGEPCTHEGGTLGTPVPTEDGTQHTATYTCCGAVVTGNHTYEDGACSACRAECSHTFTDGVCTVCSLPGGYCGASTNEGGEQSVTWTLADNHLVISGTGAMADYSSSGYRPWNDACETITDVTIGEGVTRIGKYAFYNFQSLAEITIPASVESIGYEAFGSSTVSGVTFAPNSRLTTIGDYAFYTASSLKQITLPASVETIGDSAFASCYALETVTFAEGSRLTSLGYMPFDSCPSLNAINIPESVTAYKTIDGVLYSGDGTTLLLYPKGKTDAAFTIPEGVTTIAKEACVRAQFSSLTISEGVTTLGDIAFAGCSGLRSVSLPSTLTTIGNSTFEQCDLLTEIAIPASVTSIGDSAFTCCYCLTNVTIPASVTSIGDGAFESCHNLTTVNAPCNWDGSLYTFADTVTVNVPDHVFVDGACTGCGLNGGYCGASTNEGGEQSVVWTYKDGALTISGTGAMADFDDAPWYSSYDSVTSLTISEGVTSIGEFAFLGFTRLKSATIPASVTKLGYCSFAASGLESVTFAEESQLTSIAEYAFQNCNALTEIPLPAGVTSITSSTFYNCTSLTSIRVAAGNVTYKDIDGVLYTADGKTLLFYPAGRTAEDFTTPEGVTTIWNRAFTGNYYLKAVTFSEGVTTIGELVFNSCWTLQTVELPNSLTTIGMGAFCGTGLTSIDIPAGVTIIGVGAFESCSSLTNVVIPEGVETIEFNTFAWCSSLATVTIPASVKTIDQSAFYDCNALTTANVPCSWDGSLYTFADTVTVTIADHTGGKATCQSGAICGNCSAEYGEPDESNHVGAELTWEWYPNGETAYANVNKTCPECEECYDSASGNGELLSETAGTDCQNPGTRTYTATLTWNVDETEVTGTYTEIIPSDNHVGTFSNGFCTACYGFEKPAVDRGEYENEEWDDTYLISNAGQLYWFAAEVNNGSNGIGARLTSSISMPASVSKGGSIPDWTPIGTGYSYCGDFNGAGHTISGLYCEANYAGLFGATGYNYPLTNLGVTNSTFIGGSYAGAIAGYAESSMSGCWASGNTVEGNYAGGLVGQNIGFIDGSQSACNTVKGELAGGLVGYNNNGTIARSYATGNTVTGNAAGGLVGENYGTIENSYATGNTPGYLVNYNGDPITNCYTDSSALFRDSYGDVTNSYYVSTTANDDGGRTSAQFASGEIAYLLQGAIEPGEVYDEETGEYTTVVPLVWGQSIGSSSFPSLGGTRVYQVLACDGKGTAYANTDEPQQHSYTDSVCDNCGAPCEHAEFTDCVCNGCGYVCTHEEFADDACTICGIPGGYCGNVQEGYEATSMKWFLQGGVLTIIGTGPMGEFSVPEASVPEVTAVTVTENVTSVVGRMCTEFTALKTVTLPATVSSINAAAFEGCTSLERVSIPENSQLQYIGSSAFESCSSLKGIELPASLKTTEASAFAYSGLVSIDLPEGVTSIGSLAFVRCLSLQTVTIPKSVATISESAFDGCEALTNVYVPCSWDTKPLYDFDVSIAMNIANHALSGSVCGDCGYTCPHDTGNGGACSICGETVTRVLMILPANLTTIESEAFTGTAAVAIVIPAKCTSIAAGAFTGCSSLEAVIFTSADCTIAEGAVPYGVAIVAPAGGTVEAWAEANGLPFVNR